MPKKYINLQYEAFIKRYQITSNAVLLDVRTQQEYLNEHLASAINIDLKSDEFVDEIAMLNKQKTYFIYCRKGIRSLSACVVMSKMGFAKIYHLKGGLATQKRK